MKFEFAVATVMLAASALVSAGPFQALQRLVKFVETRLDTQGAIYFITNDPTENVIMTASINRDGTLTLAGAVAAGGRGLSGIPSPISPDSIFSQGSIQASANGQVLAAVNPGSNTISLFSINPKTPTEITPTGDPVSSEGEFPVSVAFNRNGTRLCALNGGAVAGVNCFNVDKKLGLVSIPNTLRSISLNKTTPPTGPAGTASEIIFNDDETKVIVSVKGSPPNTIGFLAIWDIQEDGSLSQDFVKLPTVPGAAVTFSMTPIPGRNALLSTDASIGFTVFDLDDPSKSTLTPIPGQQATCWSQFSQKTGTFFLTDVTTSILTEVAVDGNLKGSIVKQYPLGPGAGTIDDTIATINGNDFLYVLAANFTSVDVLSLKGRGQAERLASLDFGRLAKLAGIPVDPLNLQGMTRFLAQ
ncbi:hypothetical protein BV20DRAFT_946629 [Pilatotrama ljubarskyi]|nr:hypothetical protein BV20DRAFT_946629 [Pilatotrama ljubarskyi]